MASVDPHPASGRPSSQVLPANGTAPSRPNQARPGEGLFSFRSEQVFRHAGRAILWAFVFNLLIALAKLMVAITATRSTALFSEGLHSLGDCLNSLTLWVGIRQGNRNPDRTHPFGYGLETNLWALLASFVLFVSSGYAVWSGIERWHHPGAFEDVGWAISILLVSIALEFFAVMTAARAVVEEVGESAEGLACIPVAFRRMRDVVSPTTRFVFYEDTLALLGAFIALVAILTSHYSVRLGWLAAEYAHLPDAIASMLIGALLMFLAINLFRYNRSFLTGAAASAKVEELIQTIVGNIHGVSQVHSLTTMDQGVSGLIVHLTVDVEPNTPVKDVDDLTDRIKERLQERIPNIRQVFIEVLADETEEDWEETFLDLVSQGEQKEVLKTREAVMLKNLYEFTHVVAYDVMIPRTDVIAVEVSDSIQEVAAKFIECGHSRLVVYEDSMDQVIGLVHIRDMFSLMHLDRGSDNIRPIVRDIARYPENKPVSDLLEDFKRNKLQMAAILDEHGGFAGLVTIEDVMEEIVGELFDEHDVEDLLLEVKGPNQVEISGKYDIEGLNERFGWQIPTEEFTTIAGFIFGLIGREPQLDDQVTFEDLTFTVMELDGHRIQLLRADSTLPLIDKQLETEL